MTDIAHNKTPLKTTHIAVEGNVNTSTCAVSYLSTRAATLSMTVIALMTSLSPTASEAPRSSACFCRRLSVICSLLATTCKHSLNALQICVFNTCTFLSTGCYQDRDKTFISFPYCKWKEMRRPTVKSFSWSPYDFLIWWLCTSAQHRCNWSFGINQLELGTPFYPVRSHYTALISQTTFCILIIHQFQTQWWCPR